MHITVISGLTPYKENYHGTSALPYHLLAGRGKDVDVVLYTFNGNQLPEDKIADVAKELNITIEKLSLPRWFVWVFRLHLLFIRLFLKYPIHHYIKLPKHVVEEIKSSHPDGIWVYGEEHSLIVNQFSEFRRVHTLPDSEALYYHRMLGRRFVVNDWKRYWRCAAMYPKFRKMERDFDNDHSITYHLVGADDRQFLVDMNPGIDAQFILHPHYELADGCRSDRSFHSPIRLLVAGQYNFYMKQDADAVFEMMADATDEKLKQQYVITFLGKGWEKHVSRLQAAAWNVQQIKFAPDYVKEIIRHDVQLTPISIGTGTKGKVLDALANGLLVVGSEYALENIAVENGSSCVIYKEPSDILKILKDITMYQAKYEKIAAIGQKQILTYHDRTKVAKQLFDLFNK